MVGGNPAKKPGFGVVPKADFAGLAEWPIAPAFQAGYAGSIPAARSIFPSMGNVLTAVPVRQQDEFHWLVSRCGGAR